MNYKLSNWYDLSPTHKIFTVLSYIASFAFIALLILEYSGVMPAASNWIMPVLAVYGCCQTILSWKSNQKIAYLWMGSAIMSVISFALTTLI